MCYNAVHAGRGPSGGYAQIERNVTRVCLHMVDPQCYATKSAETCVNELIDQIDAGSTAAAREQASSVAGIAAGVAAAGGQFVPRRCLRLFVRALFSVWLQCCCIKWTA